MKILHLISGGDKGGANSHLFTLLTGLMEEIDVHIVCFMEGYFYQELKQTNIPHSLFKQKFRYDMTVIGRLAKFIRQNKYDVIHAHGARANFIASCLRGRIKLPIVTTVHSDYMLDFTENLYKKLIFTELNAVSLRVMDYYITVSDSFLEMLSKRGFDREKIYTVYNAIDFNAEIKYSEKDEFLDRYKIPKDKTLVGIIGRFEKVKGHEVFLKAAARAIEKNKNLLFLLAGEGNELHALKKLVNELKIAPYVIFTGFIKDIYSFVNAIDINVLSSHSETFPYVLLEGAKMHKATVSTDVGGIGDLIKNDETGFLVKPNDYEDMANRILQFASDSELRKKLGNHLYVHASTNFSKDSMKRRHIEIYKSIIARHCAAGKRFDFILSGYYGFNNSGDEAILSAIVTNLRREKPDASILVLSKSPKETTKNLGVVAVNRYNFLELIQYMKRSKVFINGGGNLLQDVTSMQSLLYYTTLIRIAKHYGLYLMVYANGIGPLIRKSSIKRAQNALKLCDYISLRDPDSIKELANLHITDVTTNLTVDPAFTIDIVPEDATQKIFLDEKIPLDKKYFAVCFRQWKYNDTQFVQKMGAAIAEIANTHNLTPLFLPMHYPNDFLMNKSIIEASKVECYMLSRLYRADEVMGIISKTELMITMRLHALIYSVRVNVPIVGVVYDPKVRSFMDLIGSEHYIDTKEIDTKKLLGFVDDIINNYDTEKSQLSEELEKLRVLAENDAKQAVSFLGKLF